MSHSETPGTESSFCRLACRLTPSVDKKWEHLNMCGPTPCPLQLTRSPEHYAGSPPCTVNTSDGVNPASWESRTHSNTPNRCEKPACSSCCRSNTHTNTLSRDGERKTLAGRNWSSTPSSCSAGFKGQLKETFPSFEPWSLTSGWIALLVTWSEVDKAFDPFIRFKAAHWEWTASEDFLMLSHIWAHRAWSVECSLLLEHSGAPPAPECDNKIGIRMFL